MSRKVQVPLAQIVKILMMVTALVAIVALRGQCAQGISNLFNTFAPPPDLGDGGVAAPRPGTMSLAGLLDAGVFNNAGGAGDAGGGDDDAHSRR